MNYIKIDIEQGSQEWHALRKNKIGASDSGVIMGCNPWKSPFKLWAEKVGLQEPEEMNDNMRRGHELEPQAREILRDMMKKDFKPVVYQSLDHPWMIASYDGIASDGTIIEIKCPRNALHDEVPDYYIPQLQHQMYVAGVDDMFYISFHDGLLKILEVKKHQTIIDRMLEKEEEFYKRMMDLEAPELCDKDYVNMEDNIEWKELAFQMQTIRENKKSLEEWERKTKDRLIQLSGSSNCKGGGIKMSKILKKGSVNYKAIPELEGINLDAYRNKPTEYWRIS